jgi:beta-glucanase (GH16 family)
MAIHLNLAVGGVFDGPPDQTTQFPAAMEVKSVRAWPLLR